MQKLSKNIILKVCISGLVFFFAVSLFGQQERKYIREGNSYYKSAINDTGFVDTTIMLKAAASYRKAIEKAPTAFEAKYNLANALFKLKDYEAAEREFKAIRTVSTDDETKAKIFHNLGNSLLMQGKLKESIEAYKSALRLNPKDIETKYNLAFAQSKLNQMQNQDQNQNQDQDQEQDNDQNQQQQQQQGQEEQAQEQQMQEAQQNENKDDNEQQYSKEDAARILEAMQDEEQKVQDKLNKQKNKKKSKSTRDW